MHSQVALAVKKLLANVGDTRDEGSILALGIWQPTPIFLPGKFHGQRSLAGYSPQGCKESDTTKWHICMCVCVCVCVCVYIILNI